MPSMANYYPTDTLLSHIEAQEVLTLHPAWTNYYSTDTLIYHLEAQGVMTL